MVPTGNHLRAIELKALQRPGSPPGESKLTPNEGPLGNKYLGHIRRRKLPSGRELVARESNTPGYEAMSVRFVPHLEAVAV